MMDTALFIAIITAVTSSGFTSLIIYLLQRHDKKVDKETENDSAQSRMLLGLGHDKILYLTDKYVKRGAITLKEKRNLKFLSTPYFDLGGNGDCEIGCDACFKLPVVSDDEAEVLDMNLKRKEYGLEVK
jgi:hypothetical protein